MDEMIQGRLVDVEIEKEMKESYLAYSMSVIVGRALPDVRDGLKPVAPPHPLYHVRGQQYSRQRLPQMRVYRR